MKDILQNIFTEDVELYTYSSLVEMMCEDDCLFTIHDIDKNMDTSELLSRKITYDRIDISEHIIYAYYNMDKKYLEFTAICITIGYNSSMSENNFVIRLVSENRFSSVSHIKYNPNNIPILQSKIRNKKLQTIV